MSNDATTSAGPRVHVVSMLSVRNGAGAVEFYGRAFRAKVIYSVGSAEEGIVARLSVNGAEFWLSDESPEHGNFSPETLRGSTTRLLLMVDDPAAMWRRAVAAGAKEVWPVSEQHGWLVGRVQDPFGHHWEIAKELIPS